VDSVHGRVETRLCQVIGGFSLMEQAGRWEGLKCPARVESIRYFKSTGKEEKDTPLYIASLEANAQLINDAVRFLWSI
jgi:hypothetical protein